METHSLPGELLSCWPREISQQVSCIVLWHMRCMALQQRSRLHAWDNEKAISEKTGVGKKAGEEQRQKEEQQKEG